MALTARYHPEHPPGELASFGMDFSPIIPIGLTIVGGEVKIYKNTNPPTEGDQDWDITHPTYLRGRAIFAILAGGVSGVDYLLEWTVSDTRGNTWVRTGLILCAPTS